MRSTRHTNAERQARQVGAAGLSVRLVLCLLVYIVPHFGMMSLGRETEGRNGPSQLPCQVLRKLRLRGLERGDGA